MSTVDFSYSFSRTIFTKSPRTSTSVIYGIVLENFIVSLYYTPEGSNSTQDIKSVPPLASQYPDDPQGWHFMCVMVIDTELSYFLDGEYVGKKILRNSIADVAGKAQIGQMFAGKDIFGISFFILLCFM